MPKCNINQIYQKSLLLIFMLARSFVNLFIARSLIHRARNVWCTLHTTGKDGYKQLQFEIPVEITHVLRELTRCTR